MDKNIDEVLNELFDPHKRITTTSAKNYIKTQMPSRTIIMRNKTIQDITKRKKALRGEDKEKIEMLQRMQEEVFGQINYLVAKVGGLGNLGTQIANKLNRAKDYAIKEIDKEIELASKR